MENSTDREKLILKYMPLVRMHAGRIAKHVPPRILREDLASEGTVGLIMALDRANRPPTRAYLGAWIRGRIIDHLRRGDVLTRHARRTLRGGREKYLLRGGTDAGFDLLEHAGWGTLKEERLVAEPTVSHKEHLQGLMDKLSFRERRMVEQYYFLEVPQKSIGELWGVSDSRVNQILKGAIKKMQRSACRMAA